MLFMGKIIEYNIFCKIANSKVHNVLRYLAISISYDDKFDKV